MIVMNDAHLAPDCELTDDAGRTRRLSEFWAERPAAIVFVRHLGCPFCRQEAARLKADAPRFEAAGGNVVLVTMSSPDDAAAFRKQFQLPFSVLADPEQKCYDAFAVPRGGLGQIMGPKTWLTGLQATLAHGVGTPVGDVRQLSGAFVVDRSGTIRYAQRAKHSADLPSHEELLERLKANG